MLSHLSLTIKSTIIIAPLREKFFLVTFLPHCRQGKIGIYYLFIFYLFCAPGVIVNKFWMQKKKNRSQLEVRELHFRSSQISTGRYITGTQVPLLQRFSLASGIACNPVQHAGNSTMALTNFHEPPCWDAMKPQPNLETRAGENWLMTCALWRAFRLKWIDYVEDDEENWCFLSMSKK